MFPNGDIHASIRRGVKSAISLVPYTTGQAGVRLLSLSNTRGSGRFAIHMPSRICSFLAHFSEVKLAVFSYLLRAALHCDDDATFTMHLLGDASDVILSLSRAGAQKAGPEIPHRSDPQFRRIAI